jgi:hypothetical protein
MEIRFERMTSWDHLLGENKEETVLYEMKEVQRAKNPHAMFVFSPGKRAVIFLLSSRRKPRPVRAICERLKDASEQFSKTRPAMIWGHFLGFGESGFEELLHRPGRSVTPFDVLGTYLFKSKGRDHICRLRFSVDGESLRQTSPSVIIPYGSGTVSSGGPAYDLRSSVSKFHADLTW